MLSTERVVAKGYARRAAARVNVAGAENADGGSGHEGVGCGQEML